MSLTKARVGAAAVTASLALACAGVVCAADSAEGMSPAVAAASAPFYLDQPTTTPTPSPNPELAPTESAVPSPQPSSEKPLGMLLNKIGIGKPLSDAGITVGGFVEAGVTYNFDTPNSHVNVGRVFDFEDQDPTLHQVDLFIDKGVDPSKGKFDVGFHIEGIYGGDSRFIHSNGLDFYGPGDATNGGQQFPDEQVDLVQAYATFGIPVGKGLTITAGKFVTLLGQEYINSSLNQLYSRSFLFGFAIPFTHTGVLAKYNLTDKLSVTGGVTRGWEQSTKDSNEAIDGLGQLAYAVNDKLTLTLSVVSGPERP